MHGKNHAREQKEVEPSPHHHRSSPRTLAAHVDRSARREFLDENHLESVEASLGLPTARLLESACATCTRSPNSLPLPVPAASTTRRRSLKCHDQRVLHLEPTWRSTHLAIVSTRSQVSRNLPSSCRENARDSCVCVCLRQGKTRTFSGSMSSRVRPRRLRP